MDGFEGWPGAMARAGQGIGGGVGSPLGDVQRDPAVVGPAGGPACEVTILVTVGVSLGDTVGVRCVAFLPEAILSLPFLAASNGSWLMCA